MSYRWQQEKLAERFGEAPDVDGPNALTEAEVRAAYSEVLSTKKRLVAHMWDLEKTVADSLLEHSRKPELNGETCRCETCTRLRVPLRRSLEFYRNHTPREFPDTVAFVREVMADAWGAEAGVAFATLCLILDIDVSDPTDDEMIVVEPKGMEILGMRNFE